MKLFLRILQYATYPFLALSVLLFMGAGFGGAFISDFTVVNRLDQIITVTPIGAVGTAGDRQPLPLYMLDFPSLPSLHRGGYRLEPNESVTIKYDMDDINFSELVIEDAQGQHYQLITDPTPTLNQYHGPLQREFIVSDLAELPEASPLVIRAAAFANEPRIGAIIVLSIMFGPWLMLGLVSWGLRWVARHRTASDVVSRADVA